MSSEQTRRSFLKLSAAGLAVPATAKFASALTSSSAAEPSGDIAVRVTGGTLRYAAAPVLWPAKW